MGSSNSSSTTLRLVVRICLNVVAVTILVAMTPAWLTIMRPDPRQPRDFVQDWASARNAITGQPIYADQRLTLPTYLGTETRGGMNVTHNAHPPTSVLAALPFAPFDFVTAGWWWNVLSLALLAVSLVTLAQGVGWRPTPWAVAPLLALLALWVPLWLHTLQGQLGLLLLAFFTAAWWTGRRRLWGWCGALLGVAATIKVFPILVLGLLVVLGRWRGIVAGIVAAAVMTVVTALILGPQAFVDYAQIVLPGLNRWRPDWINSSITGFTAHVFAPDATIRPLLFSPPLAAAVTLVLSLVTIAVVVILARQRGSTDFDGVYALAVTASLMLSALTWSHYFVVLLLPLVIWSRRLWLAGRPALGRWGVLVATWLLMALPQLDLAHAVIGGEVATPIHAVTILALNFYGLAGFFIAQAWWLHRDDRPAVPTPTIVPSMAEAPELATTGGRRP